MAALRGTRSAPLARHPVARPLRAGWQPVISFTDEPGSRSLMPAGLASARRRSCPTHSRTSAPAVTPQAEQADPRQVPNSAGRLDVHGLPAQARLHRFLTLGTEGGTLLRHRAGPDQGERGRVVLDWARNDTAALVDRGRRRSSQAGRAPRNNPALFALAAAASARERRGPQGCPGRAAAGGAHRHAPVHLHRLRRAVPRLGPGLCTAPSATGTTGQGPVASSPTRC